MPWVAPARPGGGRARGPDQLVVLIDGAHPEVGVVRLVEQLDELESLAVPLHDLDIQSDRRLEPLRIPPLRVGDVRIPLRDRPVARPAELQHEPETTVQPRLKPGVHAAEIERLSLGSPLDRDVRPHQPEPRPGHELGLALSRGLFGEARRGRVAEVVGPVQPARERTDAEPVLLRRPPRSRRLVVRRGRDRPSLPRHGLAVGQRVQGQEPGPPSRDLVADHLLAGQRVPLLPDRLVAPVPDRQQRRLRLGCRRLDGQREHSTRVADPVADRRRPDPRSVGPPIGIGDGGVERRRGRADRRQVGPERDRLSGQSRA